MLKVPRVIKNLHRWTRLSSQKWEDAWTERLRFLDPERVVMLTWPNSRALKIEVYCDEATSKRLVKSFGGRATKVAPEAFTGTPSAPRAPLAIRGRLKVYSDEASWREWKDSGRKPQGILIPAGMAFGTGEHATTATCLRFLADVAEELPEDFSALDLGAGSGILAVAADALGAGAVSAIDYDPAAVRITRQNAKINGCKRVKSAQGDALEFDERGQYDLVMANLFSEVLISVAPRIVRAMKRKGVLIFSGVLRKQAEEVVAAFEAKGLSKPRIIARGKWCAGICYKGQRKTET